MSGDILYAWQVQEPTGDWSTVAVGMSGLMMPLIHRDLDFAMRKLKSLAQAHAKATGQPLRLAQFNLAAVME